MKKIIYIAVLLSVMISCSDDFLQRDPKGVWHEGNFTPNESDNVLVARGELAQSYAGLRGWSFAWATPAMHNYITPDAIKGGGSASDGGDAVQFPSMSFTPSNGLISSYYGAPYDIIRHANLALNIVYALSDTVQAKEQIRAEALTLRAAMYFRLTQAFGDVPYIDKVLANGEQTPPRTPKGEINAALKADLIQAIPYLSTRVEAVASGNPGRVTQNTARAIYAKMALYEKNWGEVLMMTNAIISSGDNDLSTPYADMFHEKYEFGSESIFEANADEKPVSQVFLGSQWSQVQGVRGTPNLGWGFNCPSAELVNAYEMGDPRKDATVITVGETLDGVKVIGDAGLTYFSKKAYPIAAERGIYGRSGEAQGQWINIRLIRYADIILMHAEAANELGQTQEALNKLEMVRARARGNNNSVLPKVTDTDQNILRNKIRQERRIELAMEFERYFDLIRWGIAKDVIPNFIVGKHELYPIPQSEIDMSNGVIKQNPGY